MEIFNPYHFEFEAQELPQKLRQASQEMSTGYWRFEFPNQAQLNGANQWYLGLLQGRVIFSGNQLCSGKNFLGILQRYIPHLCNLDIQKIHLSSEDQLISLEQEIKLTLLPDLLNQLELLNSTNFKEIEAALCLNTLEDFDVYLFNYSGKAQFSPLSQQDNQIPIFGCDIKDLLNKAKERKVCWQRLAVSSEAMEGIPILNTEAVESSNLSIEQRKRLRALMSNGKTLNEIAIELAKDSLEIAKFFTQLINGGLVHLQSLVDTPAVDIVIVDDSPILLKQFENLVTHWGYTVQLFNNPVIALKSLAFAKPSVIFLDINMPDISGFDLIKQIRRQPAFSEVPLVILTAEKTLSNNWRARWSGCRFLSKPLATNEIPEFRLELELLLAELIPLKGNPLKFNTVQPTTNQSQLFSF
jgi:CheY-like chemotaxis protein